MKRQPKKQTRLDENQIAASIVAATTGMEPPKGVYAGYLKRREQRKGGMEPIPDNAWAKPCNHPEHKAPTMICIPAGKQYRHVCPACGAEVILRGSNVTMSVGS